MDVMSYDSVLSSIDKPEFREKKIKKYQNTDDIIKDLIFCFKEYNSQAKPIAEKFGTGNILIDSKNIYKFLKKNIRYDAEPEKDQTTRSFSRIIHDKWGDCKHTATIVGSIGWNEGYSVIFRVVRYLTADHDFIYHVYTILENPKTGKRVIVDPLQEFNYEKKFDKKIGDFKAENNMTLTRLTGTDNQFMSGDYEPHQIGIICGNTEIIMTPIGMSDDTLGDIEHLEGIGRKTKAQRKERKAKIKAKVKKVAKKGFKVFKKLNLAPIRAAFNALLLVNFKGIATRFQKAIEMGKGDKITAFGKKFGYEDKNLKKNILKGSKKKSLGAIDENEIHHVDGIGVVVTSAAVVAASTALAAALSLLKSLGLGKKGDDKTVAEAAANIQSDAGGSAPITLDASGTPLALPEGGSGGSGGGGGGSTSTYDGSEGANGNTQNPPGGEQDANASSASEGGFMDKLKNLPMPVYVIGGGVILFALGKKFKII